MKKLKFSFITLLTLAPLYANAGILMDGTCYQNKATFIQAFIQAWQAQDYVGFQSATYVYVKKYVVAKNAITLTDPVQYVNPDPNNVGKQWQVNFTAGFTGIKPDGTGTALATVPSINRYAECESITPGYPVP